MRKTMIAMTLVMFAAWLVTGCGGGSSGAAAETPAATINLTGTVQTASSGVSGSLNKGLFKASAEDAAVPCDGVVVYELGGTEADTGTCEADGSFVLTPEKVEGEVNYFIMATYGDDEMWSYMNGTVASDTTALDAGMVDPDASLIVMDMLEQMGIDFTQFEDIAAALAQLTTTSWATAIENFDPGCYWKLQLEVIEGADPTGTGLNDDTAKNVDACKLFCYGEGEDVTGYPKPYSCMEDCVHGDFTSAQQTTAGEYIDAAGVDYLTGDDWVTNYATYAGVMDSFDTLIGDYMAGAAGSTTLTTSLSPALSLLQMNYAMSKEADATVSTPCGEGGLIETDADYADKWKEMMLEADDLDQLQTVFGMEEGASIEEAFQAMMGTMDQFYDGEDWSTFDGGSLYALYETYGGDYSSFYNDDGTLKEEGVSTVYSYYMETDWESLATEDEMEQYFSNMGETFESGTWTDYYGYDDVYADQWQSEFESDPESEFTPPDEDVYTCMSTCMGSNSDLFATCQEQCGMEMEGMPPPE